MSDKSNPFGIQNTMETGAGDAQLLNDLMAPETASGNPDDVTPIVNETDPPQPETNTDPPRGKDITPPNSVDGKTDEEKASGESLIADFLTDSDEDDDDAKVADSKIDNVKSDSDIDEEDGEEEDDGDNKFTALSNDLFKLGVFNKEEDEEVSINTPEEFLERFNAEKKKGASDIVQNFIGQFGEDYQNAFDSIFVKGVDPKEYFGAYGKVVSFSEMDLSKEQNQVSIMKQALEDQGFEPEDISKEIERLQNYGDLDTVATRHHKVLVKKEAKKLERLDSEAQQVQEQKTEIRNQYINNVQSILSDKVKEKEFDGIPINSKIANELQDFLLVDKWKTPAGETLTDFDRAILDMKKPENHEMKVKVGLLMKILEKDPSLSTIQRKGASKQTNVLFGEIARQVTKDKSNTSRKKGSKPSTWFL
tara:strand:+ start:288 stop:1550 length:1263 start_codon:yes stop_codon:yes gene_type:complete